MAMQKSKHLAAAAAASRPQSLAAAAAAVANANRPATDLVLLPPALKGIALGFLGGVITIVALTMLAPAVTQHDETASAGQNHVKATPHVKSTASQAGIRR